MTEHPDSENTEQNVVEEAPRWGYDGVLTQRFVDYAASRLSYEDLKRFVVSFPYKVPYRITHRPEDQYQASIWSEEQGGPPEIDTIEEVERASSKRLISSKEFIELHEAISDRFDAEREAAPEASHTLSADEPSENDAEQPEGSVSDQVLDVDLELVWDALDAGDEQRLTELLGPDFVTELAKLRKRQRPSTGA